MMVSSLDFSPIPNLFLFYLFLFFLLLFSCSFSRIYGNHDAFLSTSGHMRPQYLSFISMTITARTVLLMLSRSCCSGQPTSLHITSSLSRFKSYLELLFSVSLHTLIAQHLRSDIFLHHFILFGTQFSTVRTFQRAVFDAFFSANRKFRTQRAPQYSTVVCLRPWSLQGCEEVTSARIFFYSISHPYLKFFAASQNTSLIQSHLSTLQGISHDLQSLSLHFMFPQAAIAEIVAFMDVVTKIRRWRHPRT